jgi:hypothetical protein
MAISRWWQLSIGVFVGSYFFLHLPRLSFLVAIMLGMVLAFASLKSDGDDAMTAVAAGFLTGVLGVGLYQVATLLFGTPFV